MIASWLPSGALKKAIHSSCIGSGLPANAAPRRTFQRRISGAGRRLSPAMIAPRKIRKPATVRSAAFGLQRVEFVAGGFREGVYVVQRPATGGRR